MESNHPLVSIGFAVYNAESYVRRALDSLLAQDYANIELIISDNASTDATWEICQGYAAIDDRIRLYRNQTNIGAVQNFNRVYDLATGEYFMWAAHDDQWLPTFISTCVNRLEADPKAVLCYVRHVHYRETDKTSYEPDYPINGGDPVAWRRCYSLLECWPVPNVIIYGLFRRKTLQYALPALNVQGADSIILLRAATIGTFIQANEPLHIYTVSVRTTKTRIKQYGLQMSAITLLKWDFLLMRHILGVIWKVAINIQSWIMLLKSTLIFMYRVTGWPISVRLLKRYGQVLLDMG